MNPGLPILPARFPDESMSSWLSRIGAIYGMTAHQLIDEWTGDFSKKGGHPENLEIRMTAAVASKIGHHLRIPESELHTIVSQPSGWLLEKERTIPQCITCLESDDAAGRPRYQRHIWHQCWRSFCPIHRTLLTDKDHIDVVEEEPQASKKLRLIPRALYSRPLPDLKAKSNAVIDHSAVQLIRQMEGAITSAHAGRPPNPEVWGEISSRDFLRVFQDVTMFMMTNFSERSLPPIGMMEVAQFGKLAPRGSFRLNAAALPAWHDGAQATFLTRRPNIAYSRSILFWVRELLHATSGRTWIKVEARQSRVRRQAQILDRQCSRGLEWLSERMATWPERYRETWWTGARLVGLPA